jgi:hypothetical protein
VNQEFRKIVYYFRAHKLVLHPDKIVVMLFTNRNPHVRDGCILIDNNNYNDDYLLALKSPIVHVNNQPTPKVKFRGVFLDPNLNFCLLNKTISAKISNSLYHLRAG